MLKLSKLDGNCLVLNQARDGNGRWSGPGRWANGARSPAPICGLKRQIKFDPDLWILEIEDREGRAFVDEKIV